MDEWEKWETEFQQSRPVAHWFTETLPDWLEKPAEWIVDPVYDAKCYMRNRWITRTHALTSNLTRGQWHEMDQRMLHCLFDELVNFVEVEKAHLGVIFCGDDQTRKKFSLPWWRKYSWLRWSEWRCADAGVDYLNWEAQLVFDEDMDVAASDPKYGKPTSQATVAQQTLDLYNWWKTVRPARPEPSEASGWLAYYKSNSEKSSGQFKWGSVSKQERRLLKRTAQIELKYDREDQQKMIQLIKLSKSLWT
jgi:hypothetical protein